MNESVMENTEFVDRSLALVTREVGDRRIKMRETSFSSTNGRYREYLESESHVEKKVDDNVVENESTTVDSVGVTAPIERLSKVIDVLSTENQCSIVDFHPIKLRASMIANARSNGISAYNALASNTEEKADSSDMFSVGDEVNIPVDDMSAEHDVPVSDNDEDAISEEIEVKPSKEDSESYAEDINSAFESKKVEDSVSTVDNDSSIGTEPVAISSEDVKATVGSGAKLDVTSEQDAVSISPEEVEDVVSEKHGFSTDEISEAIDRALKSLEPSVSKNSTHPARVSNFDDNGNYLGESASDDREKDEEVSTTGEELKVPKIEFKMPELNFDKIFSPVPVDEISVDAVLGKNDSSSTDTTVESVVEEDANIRGDVIVVPDRPNVSNEKEKTADTEDEIEDFVVVDGGLSDEAKEESRDSSDLELASVTDELSTNQEVRVEDDNINSNDGDLQFDFSGATLKDINGAVDSVNSKSSLEDLKDRISLLLKEKEAKSKELESARKKAEKAEKQREAARKAREDAIRSLDVYRQELENSVAMVAQQSDEIEKQTEATLTEADMDFMVAEEASSLLDSVNGNEHVGGMRRAA